MCMTYPVTTYDMIYYVVVAKRPCWAKLLGSCVDRSRERLTAYMYETERISLSLSLSLSLYGKMKTYKY